MQDVTNLTVKGRPCRIEEGGAHDEWSIFANPDGSGLELNLKGEWQSVESEYFWRTREAAEAFLAQHADPPATEPDGPPLPEPQTASPVGEPAGEGLELPNEPGVWVRVGEWWIVRSYNQHPAFGANRIGCDGRLEHNTWLTESLPRGSWQKSTPAAIGERQPWQGGSEEAYSRKGEQAIWDTLQVLAPWAESNDMPWCDEILCGLAGVRDRIAEYDCEIAEKDAELTALREQLADARREHLQFMAADSKAVERCLAEIAALREQLQRLEKACNDYAAVITARDDEVRGLQIAATEAMEVFGRYAEGKCACDIETGAAPCERCGAQALYLKLRAAISSQPEPRTFTGDGQTLPEGVWRITVGSNGLHGGYVDGGGPTETGWTYTYVGPVPSERKCGKQGCDRPGTHQAWGSLLYFACDDHIKEITALVKQEG